MVLKRFLQLKAPCAKVPGLDSSHDRWMDNETMESIPPAGLHLYCCSVVFHTKGVGVGVGAVEPNRTNTRNIIMLPKY